MVEVRSETVGTLSGTGEVRSGGTRIALAQYDLTVTQEVEVISVNIMGPQGLVTERSESRRGTETSGQITVLEGEKDLMRGNRELVLHLEDGRYRPFFVQEGDPLNGTWEVGLSDSF
jgi:hypothetical protein